VLLDGNHGCEGFDGLAQSRTIRFESF
jgi:hypothetical protein